MALDHSLTYKQKSFKNYLHIKRLEKIKGLLQEVAFNANGAYLDIGCSNGYLTNIIAQKFNFSTVKGVDHNTENLQIARENYPQIEFEFIDLNTPQTTTATSYDLVTCFETLEHVGNLPNAIDQVTAMAKERGSFILISVPIEIGFWGIIKFMIKTLYGYSLNELKPGTTHFSYFMRLLSNKSISIYRDQREGWGTHYGFDYREVDKVLAKKNIPFTTKNFYSTRFYLISNS